MALAGEFFVLAELALRRLDGTLTLGHTKEIDILVLNRQTGRTIKVEVKTSEKGLERSRVFGEHYAWLMHERHGRITDKNRVYCFVRLDRKQARRRFFLVPAADVAEYVRWSFGYYLRHPTGRRRGKPSSLREFQIPVGARVGVGGTWCSTATVTESR